MLHFISTDKRLYITRHNCTVQGAAHYIERFLPVSQLASLIEQETKHNDTITAKGCLDCDREVTRMRGLLPVRQASKNNKPNKNPNHN